MRAGTILALAAAAILVAACASAASTPAASPVDTPAAATPTATPAASATPAPATPSATPVPQTDGQGDEVVRGTLYDASMVSQFTIEKVGDVTHYRDGRVKFTLRMNDPRVTGDVSFVGGLDLWSVAAAEWGTYTLSNGRGSWRGPCAGGAWGNGEGIVWGCWLRGSGDYAGYTFYQQVTKEVGGNAEVVGIIYKGEPVATR